MRSMKYYLITKTRMKIEKDKKWTTDYSSFLLNFSLDFISINFRSFILILIILE
jgi:hypothetical protein